MAKRERSRSSSRVSNCKRRASLASQTLSLDPESYTSSSDEDSSSTASAPASGAQLQSNRSSDRTILLVSQSKQPIKQRSTSSNTPGSPPVLTTCEELRATGLATPSTAPKYSHEGTIVSAHLANGIPHPASTLTHYTPTESFPIFCTGNALIQCNLVTPPKQWQLHNAILERHSAWFRRAMHIDAQGKPYFQSWLFFLLEEHEGKVALVLQQAKPRLHSNDSEVSTILAVQNNQVVAIPTRPASASGSATLSDCSQGDETKHTAIVDIYNQIFGSFYSIPLRIPSDTIETTLSFCESLVKVSHSLNCTALISAQISTALHQHRQSLYTAISSDPALWLLLSILLENSAIYTEALIHIIGAHPCWPWPTKRHTLPDEIMQLVVRKSSELDKLCMEVERELLLLTIHIHKSGPVEPHQHSHFNTWFVVQTFRDTLARTFHSLEKDRSASLKRGVLFRKIKKGGDDYMSAGEMRRLIGRIMPSAVGNLEEDLDMLKDVAKEIVEDVARNELVMDVEGKGVGYLTCIKIGDEDFPWNASDIGHGRD